MQSSAALFCLHGGGYVIGSPVQNDGLCASTAKELGIIVVSPEYRLAPEHPFPGAPHGFHGRAPDADFSRKSLAKAQMWLKDALAGA